MLLSLRLGYQSAAFQWYTFLLLNPVWNIVNSFSELQRSLAALERVFEILELAPDKPDRSSTFAGTVNGANGSRELGKRMINSERSPLF